jgi:hypothetical protein
MDYSELLDTAERLNNQVVTIATSGDNDQFSFHRDREALMSEKELASLIPRVIKNSRNTRDALSHLKTVATGDGSWALRTEYAIKDFAPILDYLEAHVRGSALPHVSGVTESLSSLDSAEVTELWSKAFQRCENDPEHAITLARSLIESACKHILDELLVPYGDSDDAPTLYKKVAAELNLAPDQHAEQVFKQTLSGVVNVVNGLSGVANKYGDRHGAGSGRRSKPSPRHARLVVNAAGTITAFVVDTWVERKK